MRAARSRGPGPAEPQRKDLLSCLKTHHLLQRLSSWFCVKQLSLSVIPLSATDSLLKTEPFLQRTGVQEETKTFREERKQSQMVNKGNGGGRSGLFFSPSRWWIYWDVLCHRHVARLSSDSALSLCFLDDLAFCSTSL